MEISKYGIPLGMGTQIELSTPYRVLSLDGGGMRGLYTATALHTLMKRYLPNSQAADRDIGKGFDLIVGTSTGGILAAALALGKPIPKIIELYSSYGRQIFPDPTPSSKQLWWAFKNRKKPSGKSEVLLDRLEDIFGNETILSLYQKRGISLCIPAVNLATNRAWVFKTPHNPAKHRDDNYKLSEVCMATSAAPIFLPLALLKNPDNQIGMDVFADGGLWANSPVLVGLVEAIEMSNGRPIEIVSIGTCPPPSGQVVTAENANRGVLDWLAGIKIVESSIDAQASGHQYIANLLSKTLSNLGRKCTLVRLPQTPPSSEQCCHLGLDSASDQAVSILSQLGKSDGEIAHSWSMADSDAERLCLKNIFSSLPSF